MLSIDKGITPNTFTVKRDGILEKTLEMQVVTGSSAYTDLDTIGADISLLDDDDENSSAISIEGASDEEIVSFANSILAELPPRSFTIEDLAKTILSRLAVLEEDKNVLIRFTHTKNNSFDSDELRAAMKQIAESKPQRGQKRKIDGAISVSASSVRNFQ